MNNPIITSENASRYIKAANRADVLFTESRYTFEYETLEAVAVRTPAYPFGEINDGEYTVNALEGICTCPAWDKNKDFCKHTLAIEFTLATEIDEAKMWEKICAEGEQEAIDREFSPYRW